MLAPIALFVFNRLEHTRKTIEALLSNTQAFQSELYIYSDGAKKESDISTVNAVREFLRGISGFKSVHIIERSTNLGLANSVIDGVTSLCERYGKVIVVEDDLIVSPCFLEFMNQGLVKYQTDEQVMQIAGYMFPTVFKSEDDALFLPFISSWGWATWDRAWRHFDPSAAHYPTLRANPKMIRSFNLDGNYDYYSMLEKQQLGKTNSWAIRWYLSFFFQGGLALYPKRTLVENIGFDGSGENCIVSSINTTRLDANFKVNRFPDELKISDELKLVYASLPKPRLSLGSIFSYILRLLR